MTLIGKRRRVAFGVAAIAASAALTLAGCSTSSSTPVPTSTAGGIATVGITTSPDSLDPNVASSGDDAVIIRQIFDSLVYETPDHQFKPWLADSWEISSNGKVYTFHLKPGVKFQDGTAFDAAAVKSNIDRILKPATKSQYAASLLGSVTGAKVIDASTVELDLSSRFGPLLEGLSQPFLGMESPAAVAKYGDKIGMHPVGTGAFAFSSYTTDQSVALVKNSDYTSAPDGGSSTVALDGVTFSIVPDTSARIGAVQSGELTSAESIPAEQLSTLKSDNGLSITTTSLPGATYSLYFNLLQKPWDDVAARKALREGLDIDSALKALYFGAYPRAWSVLSPATDGYNSATENSWTYDAAKAVSDFEALGYTKNSAGKLEKDGKVLSLRMVDQSPDNDKRLELDEILKQQLAAIGVTLDTSALEFPQYAAATQGGEYELESFSITTGSPSVLYTVFGSANQPNADQFLYNVAHYTAPEMDTWGKAAAAAATTAEANALYGQMQQKVIDEAVAIPLYVQVSTFAATSSLKGVDFGALGYPSFSAASF